MYILTFNNNKKDISFRISPYTGSKKIPNLISVKINDEEFCKNGVEKVKETLTVI